MARETSAGAVLFRREGGKLLYLLLHYAADHWDFPKGNIEEDEDDKAAVRREIQEETGIRAIDFKEPFQETLRYSYVWKSLSVNKTVRLYLAETDESAVTLSGEHKGSAWLSFDDAMAKLTYEKSKAVLQKAHHVLT
jgi:8-oxo-dGTP pyrophosphatase MutT (NUDIX family)